MRPKASEENLFQLRKSFHSTVPAHVLYFTLCRFIGRSGLLLFGNEEIRQEPVGLSPRPHHLVRRGLRSQARLDGPGGVDGHISQQIRLS